MPGGFQIQQYDNHEQQSMWLLEKLGRRGDWMTLAFLGVRLSGARVQRFAFTR